MTLIKNKKNSKASYGNTNVIKRTVLTEKRTDQLDKYATYIFEVNKDSNKRTIKSAIENIFSVKVIHVNTLKTPYGRKIAMVRVRPEDVILLENKKI